MASAAITRKATPTALGAFTFVDDNLRASDLEVSFAIIADWRDRPLAESLPFFSKVNLRRTAEDLRSRGFRVSCTKVIEVA